MRLGRFSFRGQYLLVAIAIAGLGLLAYSNRADIVSVWAQLGRLNPLILLLLPLIQLLSYYSNARFYVSFLHIYGHRANFRKLYELSLGINFVNQVFPSAGISGLSFIGYSLKPAVPSGKSTFIQLARYVLTYVSFIVLLAAAGLMLYFGGGIDRIAVRVLLLLVILIIAASVVLVFVLNRQERVGMAVKWLGICVNVVTRPFRKGREPLLATQRIERLLTEFRHSYTKVKQEIRYLGRPFGYALMGNFYETATVYVVFLAFGIYVNPGAVILAYAIANLAGLIAVVPGGIGIYEGLMVAVLASAGVPVAVGLSVTLVYRVLNMSIFLPVGFYYYTKHLKGKQHA